MYQVIKRDPKHGLFFGYETFVFEDAEERFNNLLQICLSDYLKNLDELVFNKSITARNGANSAFRKAIVTKEGPYYYRIKLFDNKRNEESLMDIIIQEVRVNEMVERGN